jgi:hypothetical protein
MWLGGAHLVAAAKPLLTPGSDRWSAAQSNRKLKTSPQDHQQASCSRLHSTYRAPAVT